MRIVEVIMARGHENIRASHTTTLEITKEKKLTVRGDCIIAVSADKGLLDLKPEFRNFIRRENARLTIFIDAGGLIDIVKAFGSSRLVFSHPADMVVRKSGYVCGRTLAINANKAACDLSRSLAKKLQNPEQNVKITLSVEV